MNGLKTLFPIGEQWEQIKGYEDYQVSSLGRVKNPKGQILKPYESNHGYLQVSVYDRNRKIKNTVIHRLVALHFIPCTIGDPEKLQVNHKDKNRHNNNFENLEWMTRSENMKHRYEVERKVIPLIGLSKKLEVCQMLRKFQTHDNRVAVIAALLDLTYDQVYEVQKESNRAILTDDERLLKCCS